MVVQVRSDVNRPDAHYRQSGECEFTAHDVIAECDLLQGNYALTTSGNNVRALVLAIFTLELAGLDFERSKLDDAVLILLWERLAVACGHVVEDRPVPFALAWAAGAAI